MLNRWSSESRSQTCLDYAESRRRKTTVNRCSSESRNQTCLDYAESRKRKTTVNRWSSESEAKLFWIMPKYRANESRVKLAWLCRVQLIFNEVNRERGIRQSTDGVSYYGCHRWQYRILEWYADLASQDNA